MTDHQRWMLVLYILNLCFRVPQPKAAVREPQKPADNKMDFDASPHWKTMLSPVAEESPSPRKGRRNDGNRGDDDDDGVLITFSTRTPPSRSMSPGSIKMQNFLRRLEQQGLSHD
ncbi:hypothetical protein VSDG_09227 [Cytospora chrysosperma]|uniref:Uncharacterized protein n=1 Tax=Cytospora chrysosperma TaxID=252740 RepID=A0A423VC67_CYTCH|nr:hypothetical protein VSDG_09227 [Valsa sordida]